MGAYKQFLSTDVIVAPLVVNKSFSFEGSASFVTNGIGIYLGANYTSSNLSPLSLEYDQRLKYNSIKQLYYTNYIPNPISGSPNVMNYLGQVVEDNSKTNVYSRFYNYEQTSLFQTNSYNYSSNYGYERFFPTGSAYVSNITDILANGIGIVSIPKNLFGDYINPNTFRYKFKYDGSNEIDLVDNGEGVLIEKGSPKSVYGIINYQHGTAIITDTYSVFANSFTSSTSTPTCSFQSSRTIYETQYKCTIRPDEFNFSLNPSLISGSTDGTVYNFATSSYFSPYVSTVGFYNENQELLMVAKLGQPLPTGATTDTTILVNIDK
jgi:hypothetical protein